MNKKIQSILLQIVVVLEKQHRWGIKSDWRITFKAEGHVPLIKKVGVEGNFDNDDWRDDVDTYIDLKFVTDDEITYFPEVYVYGSISMPGVEIKDLAYKIKVPEAFTSGEFKNKSKIEGCAKKVNDLADEYIGLMYDDFIYKNGSSIKAYKQSIDVDDDDRQDE